MTTKPHTFYLNAMPDHRIEYHCGIEIPRLTVELYCPNCGLEQKFEYPVEKMEALTQARINRTTVTPDPLPSEFWVCPGWPRVQIGDRIRHLGADDFPDMMPWKEVLGEGNEP
jgi:hypothetical protein